MAAQVRAPRYDFIDVLERVLAKGVMFEIEDDVEASATDRETSAWFRISIAGVNVFKVGAGVSWRCFLEAEEEEKQRPWQA